MRLINQFLLILFLLLQSFLVSSQSDQWINCLSHKQVNKLIESDNLMYMATSGGLIIYNTNTEAVTNFNRGNAAIPSNNILDLVIDKDSTIWLMTDIGLTAYKDGIWIEYLEYDGLIALDEKGYVNVATKTTYYYWNGNEFESLSTHPDLTYLDLYDLSIDHTNGEIWLSTSAGFVQGQIFRYSNESWFDTGISESTFNTFDMTFDSNNKLWCISDWNIYKYEDQWVLKTSLLETQQTYYFTSIGSDNMGNVYTSYNHPNEILDNYIYKIDSDENVVKFEIPKEQHDVRFEPTCIRPSTDNSTLYLGTINNGCLTFDEENWSSLPIETTDFKTNVMRIYKTEHQGLYIQSVPNSYYSNRQFFNYSDKIWTDLTETSPFKNSFQFNIEFSAGIEQDHWITLNDSLYQYDQGNWSYASFPNVNQDITEANSLIYFDHEDRKWLFNQEKNYILYESTSGWKTFKKDDYGFINSNYQSIFNHPVTKELWISGYKRIAIYNYTDEVWRFLEFSELNISYAYNSLYIDPNQNIITTLGQSIVRINEGSEIDTIASLVGYPDLANFSTILVDQDTIWLGMNGGVAKYVNDDFEVFDRTNSGIVNGYINSIVRDENENLWFSSNSGGLAIYNKGGVTEEFGNKEIISNTGNVEDSFMLELYPNPFIEEVNFILPADITSTQLKIYNQYGQLMYNKTSLLQTEKILLDWIPAGLYYIEIFDNKSQTRSIKKCIKL